MPVSESRSIPASALRLHAGEVQLLAPPEAKEGETTRRRFKLLARTVEPIPDWFYGDLVHDFEGMQHRATIPVDYCHDPDQIIGVGDTFTVTEEGLLIEGELIPFEPTDRASEILHKADAGVPYEASIDFRGPCTFEWIPDGAYTQANGRDYHGPCYLAREWLLRGVAITPNGWDSHTVAELSSPTHDAQIKLFTQGETMPKATAAPASTSAAPAAANAAPAAAAQLTATAQNATPNPAAAAASVGEVGGQRSEVSQTLNAQPSTLNEDPLKKLQQFVSDFGTENGGQWFSEGKSHAEALQLHAAAQAQQLTALQQKNAELEGRIQAAQLGEQTPVAGGTAASATPAAPVDNFTLATQAIAKRMGAK